KAYNIFEKTVEEFQKGEYHYEIRSKKLSMKTKFTSLSHQEISKVAFPRFISAAEKFRFIRVENLPGFFPYAAGLFPFKRADEDPKRMFAGEGGPKRTNKRFPYLSKNDESK